MVKQSRVCCVLGLTGFQRQMQLLLSWVIIIFHHIEHFQLHCLFDRIISTELPGAISLGTKPSVELGFFTIQNRVQTLMKRADVVNELTQKEKCKFRFNGKLIPLTSVTHSVQNGKCFRFCSKFICPVLQPLCSSLTLTAERWYENYTGASWRHASNPVDYQIQIRNELSQPVASGRCAKQA